jgi:drug/metabolite transporter (DMT)-like permease
LAQTIPTATRSRVPIVNPSLLLVAAMWAAGNLATKWLLDVLDPFALLAARMGIIAALMVGLLLTGPRRSIAFRDALILMTFGGALVAVQVSSFSYAIKMTTASEGSLLISTAPVWTAVIVAALRMERVTPINWLGIAIASGGVAVIVLGPAGGVLADAPARIPGDLLMLASAWLYAGYMVASKRWMQRLGELPVICWTFAAGGLMLAIIGARPLLSADWSRLTVGHWVGLVHVTLTGGFLALLLWYRAIGRTSASGTAVYQYLVPGFAVLGAAAFLHEKIAPLQLIGIGIALAGVCMARVPPDAHVLGSGRSRLTPQRSETTLRPETGQQIGERCRP